MMKTEKIYITGSQGWLGKGLSSLLSNKKSPLHTNEIVGLDIASDNPNVTKGDIRSKEGCQLFLKEGKDSILFHLAGVIHPKRVQDFYDINLEGTKNIIEAAIKNGIRKVVVMSSNSPIGVNKDSNECFNEDSPYNPYMHYGRSKMLMENELKKLSEYIDLVMIRAPWFYGPNQPERQTVFFQMIRDGKFPIVGNGLNKRSMSYIDNLCQGLMLSAVKNTKSGDIFWIADEKPYTMLEIVEAVYMALEKNGIQCKRKQIRLPSILSDVAELMDKTLQSLGIYHQKIHVLSEMNKTIACDITKAKRELGYHPSIEIQEGMDRSVKWCIERKYL